MLTAMFVDRPAGLDG